MDTYIIFIEIFVLRWLTKTIKTILLRLEPKRCSCKIIHKLLLNFLIVYVYVLLKKKVLLLMNHVTFEYVYINYLKLLMMFEKSPKLFSC